MDFYYDFDALDVLPDDQDFQLDMEILSSSSFGARPTEAVTRLLERAQSHIPQYNLQIEDGHFGLGYEDIETLITRRDSWIARERKCLQFLASIDKLPSDVLRIIFGMVHEYGCRKNLAESIKCPILPLAQVCRQWRQLTRESPELWTNFAITVDHVSRREELAWTLSTFLPLSGSYGLKFAYHDRSWGSHPSPCPVLVQLMLFSERWVDVTIESHAYGFQLDPFEAVYGRLPRLQHLHLELSREIGPSIDPWATSGFHIAPQLHSMSMLSSSKELLIPWTQLRSMTLGAPDIDLVLTSAIGITSLKLLPATAILAPQPSIGNLSLPSLRKLTVLLPQNASYSASGWAALMLFHHLTLPSLDELVFEGVKSYLANRGMCRPPGTTILPFLKRCNGNIRSLTFRSLHPMPDALKPVLLFLPQVKKLTLDLGDTNGDLVPLLHGSYGLLPRLETLSFVARPTHIPSIVKLVASRFVPPATNPESDNTFKTIHIDVGGQFAHTDIDTMSLMKRQGLSVKLREKGKLILE